MNKGNKIKIIIIVLLGIILIIMLFKYSRGTEEDRNFSREGLSNQNTISNENATIISTKAQIQSALTEDVSLHATYYLEEVYVTENETIAKGDKILKYTNGNYLTAPYDCVINELNIPELEGQCKNDNYINISSTNRLLVTVTASEDIIDQINIGMPATISITSTEEEITGNITNISSTASNGNFTVSVEFENTSNIKIGMSATVKI